MHKRQDQLNLDWPKSLIELLNYLNEIANEVTLKTILFRRFDSYKAIAI